jgi:hypothetical protein
LTCRASSEFLLLQPCSLFLVRHFLHANGKDDPGDRGDGPKLKKVTAYP